jgi:hypothetical protein
LWSTPRPGMPGSTRTDRMASGAQKQVGNKMPHDKSWRHQKKAELIAAMGGRCVECGTEENLQFDHKYVKTWRSRDLYANQRIRRYIEEYEAGNLELRCKGCNQMKGEPLLSAEMEGW